MVNYTLECCVDSVESAIAAEKGGATRLELCSSLNIGGTTPGLNFYREIRKHVSLPIRILLRPRSGDFLYSDYEFEVLRQDAADFREAGADGIVIGCLNADGSLDMDRLRQLTELSGSMDVALHRAFDVCRDPFTALEQAKQLGLRTILTSGGQNNCLDGLKLIHRLYMAANGQIEIMAGAGVTAQTVSMFLEHTPLRSFHMSGKRIVESRMHYRPDISMGQPSSFEYELWQTDLQAVLQVKALLAIGNNLS